jgi:hypothetical protein
MYNLIYLLSELTAPSGGILYHFSKPSAYCNVVTIVELQSMKYVSQALHGKLKI